MKEKMKQWAIETTLNNKWINNRFHKFNKKATQEEFLHSQIGFFQAVQAFPRFLCLLASQVPTSELRMRIVENIWEEHGQGDGTLFHTNSYLTYLKSLGLKDNTFLLENSKINPWVDSWVQKCLTSYTNPHSYYAYAAYLSGIEYAYARICSDVVPYIESLELHCEQTHYKKHSVLDWEHGYELLEVAIEVLERHPNVMSSLKDAFKSGQNDFLEMYNNLFMPTVKEMKDISQDEISFYYSREDSSIEKMVLEGLFVKMPPNPKVLIIASGGEHIFEMMAFHKNVNITAIDINPKQLELASKKLDYLKGIGNEKSIVLENNIGKFEKVFALLRSYFNEDDIQSIRFGKLNEDKVKWKIEYVVETLFSNKHLNAVFTDSATKYTKESFAKHFRDIFIDTLDYDNFNTNNIFLCKPIREWKELSKNIKKNTENTVEWVNGNPKDYIKEEYFDIVDISNIGDWMSQADFQKVIEQSKKNLKQNGILIARKLLGDYDLEEVMKENGFEVDAVQDETHFYSETIIGKK